MAQSEARLSNMGNREELLSPQKSKVDDESFDYSESYYMQLIESVFAQNAFKIDDEENNDDDVKD